MRSFIVRGEIFWLDVDIPRLSSRPEQALIDTAPVSCVEIDSVYGFNPPLDSQCPFPSLEV